MDALGFVLVGGGDDFNDLITGELKRGNVHCGAMHEVGVEHAQDGFVGDDKEVGLLALKFENDGLEADGEVVVRLAIVSLSIRCMSMWEITSARGYLWW